MRSYPPSAQPNIENTKRTHSPRQAKQNKTTPDGFVGQGVRGTLGVRRIANPPNPPALRPIPGTPSPLNPPTPVISLLPEEAGPPDRIRSEEHTSELQS